MPHTAWFADWRQGKDHRARGSKGGRAEVDVAPFREAFERSGMTKAELARRLGWFRPDTTRVSRTLGFRPDSGLHGLAPQPRQTTSYESALRLARALDVDPVDLGI